jgi:hypothetical protein
MYMNGLIKNVKQRPHGYVPTGKMVQLDVILFANDFILLASIADDLQRSIYNVHIVGSKYNIEISTEKSRSMAFCEKEPVKAMYD